MLLAEYSGKKWLCFWSDCYKCWGDLRPASERDLQVIVDAVRAEHGELCFCAACMGSELDVMLANDSIGG